MPKKRPTSFNMYVGQERIVPLVKAELETGKPFRHTLLFGPPGVGKSALCHVLACQSGSLLFEYVASESWKSEQIVKMLLELPIDGYDDKGRPGPNVHHVMLLIDEIHCMRGSAWEAWYSALSDFHVYKGGSPSWVPYFTLLGATNRPEDIPRPFIDRCPLQLHLQPYTDDNIMKIIQTHFPDMNPESAMNVARRSRGIPRRALSFAETVTMHGGSLQIFEVMGITEDGLEPKDQLYIQTLRTADRPLSLGVLSAALGESRRTVQEHIEPYLLSRGYIAIDQAGRQLTTSSTRGRRSE